MHNAQTFKALADHLAAAAETTRQLAHGYEAQLARDMADSLEAKLAREMADSAYVETVRTAARGAAERASDFERTIADRATRTTANFGEVDENDANRKAWYADNRMKPREFVSVAVVDRDDLRSGSVAHHLRIGDRLVNVTSNDPNLKISID